MVDFKDPRNCLEAALRRGTRVLSQRYNQQLAEVGLTGAQFSLLNALHQAGAVTIQQLAQYTATDRTTLTRNLKSLLAERWVKRQADPEDGRRFLLSLTPKGEQKRALSMAGWQQVQEQTLSRLGQDEARQLMQWLDKLS